MTSIESTLLALTVLVFLIWFIIVLPASMATRRNRSALGWVLVSSLGSPVLAIILLLILGDAPRS